MDYYSAIERTEILRHATAWMSLSNIYPNCIVKQSATKKTTYAFDSADVKHPEIGKFIQIENE